MVRGALLAALAACGSSTSLPVDARCNPLGAGACLAPWPSSAFEVDDPATVTGRRLAIPEDAIPRGVRAEAIDPRLWNALDGFSPTSPIVVEFPGGVSDLGLPAADNMDPSLARDSPTVILDLTTTQRVAHWAELGDDDTTLVLHPAARLELGHRYAVAITSRVVASDGSDLPISPGFRALLSDRRTDHALLEAMRGRIDEVFDAFDEAGVTEDLVLAWDFTVASEASLHADLVTARERVIETLATHPSLFKVTETETAQVRTLTGTLDAPLALSNGGEPRVNTRLVRDEAGQPAIQGLYRVPFAAVIPKCATARAPVVLWGHAPFRDGSDTLGVEATQLASALCAVLVGLELRGRSSSDVPAVERAIADLGNAGELDVIVQGVVDHATLIRALPAILGATPTQIFYAGPSAAIAALPELARAAIVDPVEPRSLFVPAFQAYTPIDAVIVRALVESRWDRVQPTALPHPVLVQARAGETTSWLARTFALPLVDPASTPWGVRTVRAPHTGSGVVLDLRLATLREFFTSGQIASGPPM